MRTPIAIVALIAVLGCGQSAHQTEQRSPLKQPEIVNISIENASINTLDWVELDWNGPAVPGGIIPPNVTKTTLSAEWPSALSAIITFVDKTSGKPYKNGIPLIDASKQIKAGGIQHVTFRILSYDKTVVVCE